MAHDEREEWSRVIAVIGLVVGVVTGLLVQPVVPVFLQPYLPIAVVAALDAIFSNAASIRRHLFKA